MINVVAALIYKDDKILITKRSTGDKYVLGKWEFPGGKIEENEKEVNALKREIKEELEIEINVKEYITNTIYEYPTKTINLKLYKCEYINGEITLHDHKEYKWIDINNLLDYDLASADIVLAKYIQKISIDKGAQFVINNFKKAVEIVNKEEYKEFSQTVNFEFNLLKSLRKTGDAYDYFLKFYNKKQKHSNDFKFLNEFNLLTNEDMVDYLINNYKDELNNRITIEDFIVNNIYTNSDLFLLFKDMMKGIRYNKEKNIIGIIIKHDDLYEDYWDEFNVLHYTGEGKRGNQSPNNPRNKALILSREKNSKIYLFDSISPDNYKYLGEAYIDGTISVCKGIDIDGNIRDTIQFPIKLKNNNIEVITTIEEQKYIEKNKENNLKKLSQDKIHNNAKLRKPKNNKKKVIMNYIERDPIVSKDVKNRAKGICDLCENLAPFETKDGPYLESHHVIMLSNGGPDVIYNAVALCPNCHRKMHSLKRNEDINTLKRKIYNYLKNDNDINNMEAFKELFNIKK